jgi:hypothetical protein
MIVAVLAGGADGDAVRADGFRLGHDPQLEPDAGFANAKTRRAISTAAASAMSVATMSWTASPLMLPPVP